MGRWLTLLKDSNVWGIVLGRSLTDPIWWFYVFWLPQYLSDARGFSLKQIAAFAWIPFVAADIGNFTGGLRLRLPDQARDAPLRARKWVCVISSLPILAGIPAARIHNPYAALALIAFAVWGYASWSTMGLTFPSDLFPQDVVASVTGVSGLGAGLAGALFTCGGMAGGPVLVLSRVLRRRHHPLAGHGRGADSPPTAAGRKWAGEADRQWADRQVGKWEVGDKLQPCRELNQPVQFQIQDSRFQSYRA